MCFCRPVSSFKNRKFAKQQSNWQFISIIDFALGCSLCSSELFLTSFMLHSLELKNNIWIRYYPSIGRRDPTASTNRCIIIRIRSQDIAFDRRLMVQPPIGPHQSTYGISPISGSFQIVTEDSRVLIYRHL